MGRRGLRIIKLKMILKRMDKVLIKIIRREGIIGNIEKGKKRIIVVVEVKSDRWKMGNMEGKVKRKKKKLKKVIEIV